MWVRRSEDYDGNVGTLGRGKFIRLCYVGLRMPYGRVDFIFADGL